MAQRNDRQIRKFGVIALAGLLLVGAATFNLQRFPGFRGQEYSAEVTDAAGLRVGAEVQVAGIRVGRVNQLRIGDERVLIDFDVDDARLGSDTRASIEVKNLLGEKFLNLRPSGGAELPEGSTIPLARTEVTFDIVGTLGQLTTQTEETSQEDLTAALNTLADTIDAAAPETKASFVGLSRLSETIASRDAEIEELLVRSRSVLQTLDSRKGDLLQLMDQASVIFDELELRKETISRLLVNANDLVLELEGLVEDNREQLKPTLDELDEILDFLVEREDQVETLLRNYGPYVNILGNIVGSGPWFDAYVPNVTGVFTGEFVPDEPGGGSR